MLPNVGNELTN